MYVIIYNCDNRFQSRIGLLLPHPDPGGNPLGQGVTPLGVGNPGSYPLSFVAVYADPTQPVWAITAARVTSASLTRRITCNWKMGVVITV